MKRAEIEKSARKIVATVPLHLVLPSSALKEYAFLNYLQANSSPEELCEHLAETGQVTFKTYAATKIAEKAAFAASYDEMLEELLTSNMAKYPEMHFFFSRMSEYQTFRGNKETALFYALRANFIAPQFSSTAARAINLRYTIFGPEHTDEAALQSLRRFPNSSPVLWAVCKNCTSEAQLDKILQIWQERNSEDPYKLARAVRPLANAASRACRFDIAVDLYARAILLELEELGINKPFKNKQLAGKNTLEVISDLSEAFQKHHIPFFLCAGTSLGIVRDGKPLDHDYDIDVGVWEDHWDKEKLIEIFNYNPRFRHDIPHPSNPKISLVHRSGISVDLFRFYREKDYFWHDGVFVRWRNSPFSLKTVDVNGLKIQIPHPSDKYLTENYGDWRTPDEEFDAFLSDNTEVIWPEYLTYYLVREAYKKIRADKMDGARQNLWKAKDILEETSAGKELIGRLLSENN